MRLSCGIKEFFHGLFKRSKNKKKPLRQTGLETSYEKDSKLSFLAKFLLLLLFPFPCYMDVGAILRGGTLGKLRELRCGRLDDLCESFSLYQTKTIFLMSMV